MLYQLGAMTFEVYPLNVGTVEREGGDKPVCVAESLARLYA